MQMFALDQVAGRGRDQGVAMTPIFTLDQFEGRWRMALRILHDNGDMARAEGCATLTRDDSGLVYSERGRLRMRMQTYHFERRYLWRPAGDGIEVQFEDGRVFHSFAPKSTATGHVCPPDRYRVIYTFDLPCAWSSRWRVDGPRKAYAIETLYRR